MNPELSSQYCYNTSKAQQFPVSHFVWLTLASYC